MTLSGRAHDATRALSERSFRIYATSTSANRPLSTRRVGDFLAREDITAPIPTQCSSKTCRQDGTVAPSGDYSYGAPSTSSCATTLWAQEASLIPGLLAQIFHALSYELGIFGAINGSNDIAEETMAQGYTEFVGLGR